MTGIDIQINRFIQLFHSELWTDIDEKSFNGVAYRNERDNNIIAELFRGSNEYEELMFDDSLNVLSFFDLSGNEAVIENDLVAQDVSLIFAVNLNNLYPDITDYRAIQESHRDVLNVIKYDSMVNIDINGITSGLNAYNDLFTDNLRAYNMQPYHTFSINLTIKYYNYC